MRPSFLSLLLAAVPLAAQSPAPAPEVKPNRTFVVEAEVKRSSVKSQGRTGTCWDFSATSYFESELQRLGKGDIGLSEMFVVRHTWPRKAWHYLRMQGATVWSQGGQGHDWLDTVKAHGIVPREAYTGLCAGETEYNHGEMDSATKGFMDVVAKGKQPTTKWPAAFAGILDAYLGASPATFTFNGKSYTPASFRDSLGLDLDAYVEITSFSHHPFYAPFRLEIPDNWSQNARYYNLPIDEMEQVVVHALSKGHSVLWDGDVSEKGFDQKKLGYAYLPAAADQKDTPGVPEKELEVTQELRQKAFDDFRTTDDHLMHLVGLTKDQAGNRFFLTKNSWGEKNGPHNGYIHMSRAFLRMKTVNVLVHKDAIPGDLRKKLGLK